MLWLAINDTTFPLPDGYTRESLKHFFIERLFDLGRAHNWDSERRVRKLVNGIEKEVSEQQEKEVYEPGIDFDLFSVYYYKNII